MDLESASHIARSLGLDERGLHIDRIPGGDIAESWLIAASDCRIFLKTLPTSRAGVLSAEADGLSALAAAGAIRTPRVIGSGRIHEQAWLAMEFLDLDQRSNRADRELGRSLARLHRSSNPTFGWHRSNFLGLTPQSNQPSASWAEFFLWQRLGPQLDRLNRHDPTEDWQALQRPLFESWQKRFSSHRPQPSLIHGDLWNGNAAMTDDGEPVIFDPAVHYADRECDLAMTRLFGGFSDHFYSAYDAEWPPEPGRDERLPWYQLYHVLNHANLFGQPYTDRAKTLITRLV